MCAGFHFNLQFLSVYMKVKQSVINLTQNIQISQLLQGQKDSRNTDCIVLPHYYHPNWHWPARTSPQLKPQNTSHCCLSTKGKQYLFGPIRLVWQTVVVCPIFTTQWHWRARRKISQMMFLIVEPKMWTTWSCWEQYKNKTFVSCEAHPATLNGAEKQNLKMMPMRFVKSYCH